MIRDQVFISYSHADSEWLERLQTMLTPLQRQGTLDVWADTCIQPGQRWKEEIQKALTRAKVAVLLVSPDFLASEFIHTDELPPLLEASIKEGLTILWVPVRPSLYSETAIAHYQAAHDPSRPLSLLSPAQQESALVVIAKKLKMIRPLSSPASAPAPAPTTTPIAEQLPPSPSPPLSFKQLLIVLVVSILGGAGVYYVVGHKGFEQMPTQAPSPVANPVQNTTAPTVFLTTPTSGSTVSGEVTVSAAASDKVGAVGVQFKLDGANLGAENTAPPYSITWNTITTTNGAHSLTAVARDAAGNTKTSTTVNVTVENTSVTPPSQPGSTPLLRSGSTPLLRPGSTPLLGK